MVTEIQSRNSLVEQGRTGRVNIGLAQLVFETKFLSSFDAFQYRGIALFILVNTCSEINFSRIVVGLEFHR